MTGLSKRQLVLKYKFNAQLVETLLREGVLILAVGCSPRRQKIDVGSLGNLVEGTHYIVCLECGAFQASLTTKHLRVCSGRTLADYKQRHPAAPLSSTLSVKNHAKTGAQKQVQSQMLKSRFRTPEGMSTRQQISAASKRLHASGYRKQAAAHLKKLNADPEQRRKRGEESKARWVTKEFRERIQSWQEGNREAVLASAAHARRHIRRKCSRPHMAFKRALLAASVGGFETEHEVGYYSIDEGHPDLKIAVEVDGCYWHGCKQCGFPGVGEITKLDRRKTTYLTRRGWEIIRFPEHEIKVDLDGCVDRLRQAVERRLP